HRSHIALADQRDRPIVDATQAVDDVGPDAAPLRSLARLLQVVLQSGRRTLERQKLALDHPRAADAELSGVAASGDERFEQELPLDAELQSERDRLSGASDVERDED